MRGRNVLNRVCFAAAGFAVMVTPSFAYFGGLYNTGEGMTTPGHHTLGAVDSHWQRDGGSVTTYWNNAYSPSNSFDVGGGVSFDYLNANSGSTSNWIGIVPFGQGVYTEFTLTFAASDFFGLSGVNNDYSLWSFGGIWSSDNASEIIFNGVSVATHGDIPDYYGSYKEASSFMVGPGSFQANNTLTVRVFNDPVTDPSGNPAAMRLAFTTFGGGGQSNPVPEPFTMALGAAGIGLAMRRRMKKSSAK